MRGRIRHLHAHRFDAPPLDPTLVAHAEALGEPTLLFEALTTEAGVRLFADDLAGSEAVARQALAMYRADPSVAVPGELPGVAHLFNRLHVVADWHGQLRDAYRFGAEALVAAGPEAGQGVLLADVFGSEVSLGVVGRATELYAATGWRTPFHAPGGRWAEVSIARLLAAEGSTREAAEWLIDLADAPESPDLPLVLRWQLAAWAGLYGVEHGQWDVASRALARLEQLYRDDDPFSRRHRAELDLLRAETTFATGDVVHARGILADLATRDDPYHAAVFARAALLRATDALDGGRPDRALGALDDAAARFDVLPAQLRPRYDRLRRAALRALGDHRALADDLTEEIDALERPRRRQLTIDVLGEDLGARLDGVFDELQTLLVGQLRWERGEVVEAISHDLAGAMGIVRLSLGMLDADRERVIEALRAATQRMRSVVDAFAVLVSIERSRLRPALTPHRFVTLVERVVANARPLADAKGMVINLAVDDDADVVVHADVGFFEMSLSNVLANAVKFAPPGSPIGVHVRQSSPTMVAVSVTDTGPGLSRSEIESVFQRHVRGRARATGGEPSLGLGLYISRAMCELMGGRVWAESAGYGNGSTFIIALPQVGQHSPAPEPAPQGTREGVGVEGLLGDLSGWKETV